MTEPQGLDRRAALARLLRERGDAALVTGLGSPTYDAFAAGDTDHNFYLWGGMGGAAMLGLGLALAQPQRRVAVPPLLDRFLGIHQRAADVARRGLKYV